MAHIMRQLPQSAGAMPRQIRSATDVGVPGFALRIASLANDFPAQNWRSRHCGRLDRAKQGPVGVTGGLKIPMVVRACLRLRRLLHHAAHVDEVVSDDAKGDPAIHSGQTPCRDASHVAVRRR
jgi:hypothetical protein